MEFKLKEYTVTYKNLAGEQHRRILWAANPGEALQLFTQSQYYSKDTEIISVILTENKA